MYIVAAFFEMIPIEKNIHKRKQSVEIFFSYRVSIIEPDSRDREKFDPKQ
jgi:hypothetical protein